MRSHASIRGRCLFTPLVHLPCLDLLLFLVLIDTFLDALGDQLGLLFGLSGPLVGLWLALAIRIASATVSSDGLSCLLFLAMGLSLAL